jgi:TorA maturation chaperone TorD
VKAARARARAYALLADLAARGVTEATREAAALSPAIAAALDRYDDPDGPAVDHQFVFGDNVYPIEGAFLDPDGQVGGAPADRLGGLYASCGFHPDPRSEPPEHLANELRALAFLSAAEADALRDGEAAIAAVIAGHQRALLAQHLLRWVPALAIAVHRAGRPFPTALIDQIEELLLLHAAPTPAPSPASRERVQERSRPALASPRPDLHARDEDAATPPPRAEEGQGRGWQAATPAPRAEEGQGRGWQAATPAPLAGEGQGGGWQLPEMPELLADPEVSLRRIAVVLATPARAGVFLSRADLAGIGRRLHLPRGFGSRVDLLENLLAAAGRFDAVEPLLAALAAVVSDTRDTLAQARYVDEAVSHLTAPWRARCDETLALLDGLGTAVRALAREAG